MVKVGDAVGKCPACGREYRRPRPVVLPVVCDCYRDCPMCGATMEPYSPDLDPTTYGREENPYGQSARMDTIMRCPECGYLSSRKPVEVELS